MSTASTNVSLSENERWGINGEQQIASSAINYSPKTVSLLTKDESIPVIFLHFSKFVF